MLRERKFMKPPVFRPDRLQQYGDEQIDVVRIRLWNSANATAVLSDFNATERVITRWGQGSDSGAVRYEVTFVDGYVLSGSHEFFVKGKRKCTFCTHLRRLFTPFASVAECLHAAPPGATLCYGIPVH